MRRTFKIFGVAELPRLITMMGMLVVLGMMTVAMKQTSSRGRPTLDDLPRPSRTPSAASSTRTSSSAVDNKTSDSTLAQFEPGGPAPLDQDLEQRIAVEEEFQAVTDKTTKMQREEMPAYWRLMTWVTQQPFESLKNRSRRDLTLNDLMLQPENYRGQLIRLDLHVSRVLEIDAPRNALGLEKLYEVWGWSSDSHAWLYVGVCPELPDGFPVGTELVEQATLYGYFFKLQGYLEAGAAPRSEPLAAPLVIGRLHWQPRAPATLVGSELPWIVGIAIGMIALLAIRVIWMLGRKKLSFHSPVQTTSQIPSAEQWLSGIQRAGSEGAPPANLQRTMSQKE